MKRALIYAAMVLALVSCSDPEVSQVIVRIEADPGVVAMTRSLEVQIDGGATRGAFSNAETLTLDGNSYPRHIAIAPKEDDPSRFYRVVARARRQTVDDPVAETFAQAALIGTYVRGETRVVVLRIEDSCINVVCGADQHCTDAGCTEPPFVEPEPADGGVPDMTMPDLGSDMGPGRCATDTDCDDGIECTIDACTTGTCTFEPSNAACPAPANSCMRAVCAVGAGCSEEPRTGPCDNGEFCDGTDSCVDGMCTGSGDPCIGMSECDETIDACTGCVGDGDCTNGESCVSSTCTCPGATEDCTTPGDEDCNGLSDCADFACNGESCGDNDVVCTEGTCDCLGEFELCANGTDDDCNGAADCGDSACEGRTCGSMLVCMSGSCEPDDFEICDNGVDDDDDGAIDCLDTPECDSAPCVVASETGFCAAGVCEPSCSPMGSENTELRCSDGVDNDCDGQPDCSDMECMGTCFCGGFCDDGGMCVASGSENNEFRCSDGFDNDCDGQMDCDDTECVGTCFCSGFCDDASMCSPSGPEDNDFDCDNGLDDDCDGLFDCDDDDCDSTCFCGGLCGDASVMVEPDPP